MTIGALSDPDSTPPSLHFRIHDIPPDERPRERLMRLGPKALSDSELIALFINTGRPGENAMQVAQRLIRSHGSLGSFSKLDIGQLKAEKCLGPAKAALLSAAFEIGRRMAVEEVLEKPLNTPEQIEGLIGPELRSLSHEVVRVILVNTKLGFLRQEQISHGTINEATAHPRDILRPVLVHTAFGFILAHNHPSGDPSPSDADRRLTRRVKEAADLLSVTFFDHIIIGTRSDTRSQGYFSFRESGLL